MKLDTYNKVGTLSVLLSIKLNELKACQEEKQSILEWIDDLVQKGQLEQSAKLVHNKMTASLERFKKVIAEIEEFNKNEE